MFSVGEGVLENIIADAIVWIILILIGFVLYIWRRKRSKQRFPDRNSKQSGRNKID